jgi:hypothetical protein
LTRRYKLQLAAAAVVLLLSMGLGYAGVAGAVWVACAALLVLFGLVINLGPF